MKYQVSKISSQTGHQNQFGFAHGQYGKALARTIGFLELHRRCYSYDIVVIRLSGEVG